MSNVEAISNRLNKLKFPTEVLDCYRESHRYYHTSEHLMDVITQLEKLKEFDDELFLAAVYHDSVYDPKAPDNEEKSAEISLYYR